MKNIKENKSEKEAEMDFASQLNDLHHGSDASREIYAKGAMVLVILALLVLIRYIVID